jgi:hypothetical protein
MRYHEAKGVSGADAHAMSEHTATALFEQLRGEQLSAVTFVQDYLQLWFDGPGINVTNPLTVHTNQLAVTSWQPGFRDALCSQIAKIVAAVECREGEAFIIRFEDGSRLSISLRPQDYTTPEAVYAHGFRGDVRFVA